VIDDNVGGNESRRAALASECANAQNQFWPYHDIVFANQQGEGRGAFRDARLKAFAEQIGLDMAAFNQCFDSSQYSSAVQADEFDGRSQGVTGTPTLFINGARVPQQAMLDFNALKQLIDTELARP
jgi:protein-disulfide isomerase